MEKLIIQWSLVILSQLILVSSIFIQNLDYDNENKKPICPTGCNEMACRMGIVTCTDSGLMSLPNTLPRNTKKILIINQNFSSSKTLSRINFTEYNSPQQNITKITIQNCSLEEIKSATFIRLSRLETLDLSFNKLREIKPHTFTGLNLKFLRLDGNNNIQMSALSFQDLQVYSLSLIDCSLTEIYYTSFEPLVPSLRRLMVSKNRLKTIESKFDPLFQRLELIGLEDNHFDCSLCSLFWLIGALKSKILRTPSVQKILFPRCYEPYRFKDRYIHDLAFEDIECPKPSVHKISILILPNNSATLTCTASDFQSQVVWTQLNTFNQTMPLTIIDRILSKSVHSNNLMIDQKQPTDLFACTVTSPMGNQSSTKLQISWPKSKNIRKQNGRTRYNTAITTVPIDTTLSNNYFFQPQFSLIEMIAGVVGTFIGTLIVFIALLRCIFYRMKIFTKTSQLRDHQLSLSSSKKEKRKHYMTYEPPIYSDSQTYDIPALASPKVVNQSTTIGHFIDFKTQQTLYDRDNK